MVKTRFVYNTSIALFVIGIWLPTASYAFAQKDLKVEVAADDSEDFIRVPGSSSQAVSQKIVGKRGCGPTALLYAFKLGPQEMKTAYDDLPGKDDESKLKNMVDMFANKPSHVSFHKVRLEAADGMAPRDLFATALDLINLKNRGLHISTVARAEAEDANKTGGAGRAPASAPYLQTAVLRRHDDESKSGLLVKRIYDSLKASVASHVPVVANLVPYVSTYRKSTNTNEWSEHTGHYVVITGISKSLHDGALGFNVEFLDPETGREGHAFIYEELVRNYWARQERADGTGEWIHPTVKLPDGEISSPYLAVTAPGLNLTPPGIKDSQRIVVSFMNAIGHFSN